MYRLLCILFAMLLAGDAWAFRCGHDLVQVGDYQFDVLEKCGEPDSVKERTAIRASRLRHPYGSLEYDRYDEVLIEEWIYDFGPRKFRQFLQFEDGELKKIKSLSYGR